MIPGQHLIKHHSAAVLVATGVYNAGCLFGGHVAHGTAHGDGLAEAGTGFQGARDPEIGDYQTRIFLVDQNILRFNVAVNNGTWSRMCIIQCIGELVKIMDRFGRGKRTIGLSEACA